MCESRNFSFPKQLRLNRPSDYQAVFANPIKSSDGYFTLLAHNTDLGYARLGLAIAKKNIKKAVHRNMLKRTIRESFRIQENLGSIDIVVLARREALDAPTAVLRKSLAKHWLRIVTRCASHSSH